MVIIPAERKMRYTEEKDAKNIWGYALDSSDRNI
jgi:hypothetical protein